MARATDRTLIASLGFADPDRQTLKHSLACQYLTQHKTSEAVWRAIRPELFKAIEEELFPGLPTIEGQRQWHHVNGTDTEVQIVKGEGKYATTIGFLDAVIDGGISTSAQESWDKTDKRPPTNEERAFGEAYVARIKNPSIVLPPEPPKRVPLFEWKDRYQRIAIEVKTTECDVSEIARQIELYSQYVKAIDLPTIWVAALTWRMHPESEAVLTRKRIKILHLGPAFDAYCDERAKSADVGDTAITI